MNGPDAEISTTLSSSRIGPQCQELAGYGQTTDYIEITPFEKLAIYAKTKYNCKAYVFYDEDKNIIYSYPPGTMEETKLAYETLVVPENAKYIRASYVEGDARSPSF